MVAQSIQSNYKEIDARKSVSIVTYADDIVVLGEIEDNIKLTMEESIQSAKTTGCEINENKIKYTCMTRKPHRMHQARNIQIEE